MAGPFIFKTASGGSPSLLRMKATRNAINRLVLWKATVQLTYEAAIRPRSETDEGPPFTYPPFVAAPTLVLARLKKREIGAETYTRLQFKSETAWDRP